MVHLACSGADARPAAQDQSDEHDRHHRRPGCDRIKRRSGRDASARHHGGYFLVHGGLKLFVFTPAGTAGYFASIGLPGVLAYLTIAAELLGGLVLIVGWRTRIAALALVPVLLGAAWFGHGGNGFIFSNAGGGWEFPLFWAMTLVVQALLGDGAWALGGKSAG